MINLLLGPPGAGKSYEAVVFHVLVALEQGRKIITNLPLEISELENRVEGASDLIEIRKNKLDKTAFSTLQDYGDDWRHVDGYGPLYVIDECHKPLPRGETPRNVEEWYAEHRHEGADVLLITQSYGKISKSIIDMVQNVYRVRKASALGFSKRYIRKVQDGVRGEVVNETIRKYDPKNFCLYKSHTKSLVAVNEDGAKDIRPIWKHWSIIGALILLPLGLVGMYSAGNPMKPKIVKPVEQIQQQPVKQDEIRGGIAPPGINSSPVKNVPMIEKKEVVHPFSGLVLHIEGYLESAERQFKMYSIAVAQNGQAVFRVSDRELVQAGYKFEPIGPCVAKVSYLEYQTYIRCDAPRVGVNLKG